MRFTRIFTRQAIIARVAGIPVRADLWWLIVLCLIAFLTTIGISGKVGNFSAALILGFAVAFTFFLSIFLHELAHAVTALREKLGVVEIVLHPFGGFTRFVREPETPRAEFRIAIAGPLASIVLALIFAVAAVWATTGDLDILAHLLFLLALANFLLAIFNLFPGYPLDGGRVLRAYLRKNGKSANEATMLTAQSGKIIGVVLIVLGILIVILRADFFTGFWAVLTGIFIFDAARGIAREVEKLEELPVDEIMQLPAPVAPETTIQHFIDNILPLYRHAAFPVSEKRHLYGILLLKDLKKIDREKWRKTAVGEVMRPIIPEHFVEIGTSISDANRLMEINRVNSLGVVDGEGRLVGFINGRKTRLS